MNPKEKCDGLTATFDLTHPYPRREGELQGNEQSIAVG